MNNENRSAAAELITPTTTLDDLFNTYPQLEDKLIEIAPVFKKLKSPLLRKTVTKVTTLKQAATIGDVSIGVLINALRKEVGLNEIGVEVIKENIQREKPSWVLTENIKLEYNASIDLENGIHPAGKVTKEILQLEEEEIYLLVTPFVPAPLIQIVEEKGFETFTEQAEGDKFNTYIKMK